MLSQKFSYSVAQKNGTLFVRVISSSNIDQFSNFFHCQNQEKIFNTISHIEH